MQLKAWVCHTVLAPQPCIPQWMSPSFTYLCSLLNLHLSDRCWPVVGWTAPPPPSLNRNSSKIPRTQGSDPSWVVARHGVSSTPPRPPHFTIRGYFIVFFTTQVKKC